MAISVVAPCGLVCDLCLGFQREKNRCSGCVSEGGKPSYCVKCSILHCTEKNGDRAKPCNACSKYPCKRLKTLEKRYSSNYGESLIQNFHQIDEKGKDVFLAEMEKTWTCSQCGHLLTVHRTHCLHCSTPNIHYLRKQKHI